MRKVIAIIILSLLMIILMPGLMTSTLFNHIVTASTNNATVTFYLNETKNITIVYFIDDGFSYDYATINQSSVATIPSNTTIYLYSYYPFEVNGKTAVHVGMPSEYTYNMRIVNSTIIYINFLPKPPSYYLNSTLPQPVSTINAETLQYHQNSIDVSSIDYYIILAFIILFFSIFTLIRKLKS